MVSRRSLAVMFSLAKNPAFNRRPSSSFALPAVSPTSTVLVDGTALMYRSYFAMPSLTRSDPLGGADREVGAVVGFLNTMLGLLVPMPVDGPIPTVLVVFDSSGPTFRDEISGVYKAQRKPQPEDLRPQMDLAKQACDAMGFPHLSSPGHEGDDLVATLVQATSPGRRVVIVGSDKDFFQLVTEDNRVVCLCPSKKRVFTAEAVHEKFGVKPSLMVDLQSLCGDTADNIGGIPGIGPKTAAELLNAWGSLDAVLANAEKLKQKARRERLMQHGDDARLARQLVTLKKDVPAEGIVASLGLELRGSGDLAALCLAPTPFNSESAEAFAQEHSLWQVAKRIRKGAK